MTTPAKDTGLKLVAAIGLGLGSVLGMTGSFVSSEKLRGLAWGIDGVSLVIASALLAVHFFRRGEDIVAAGYLVFAVGQGLVLSAAAMSLSASIPLFGAGASLWAAALVLISMSRVFPLVVRLLGIAAGAMFAATAMQIFYGVALHPKSEPLPTFAYPVFVAAIIGWIVTLLRSPR